MIDRPKRQSPLAAGSGAKQDNGSPQNTAPPPIAQRPAYLVVVDADLPRIWRQCDTLAEAVAVCAYLRGHVPVRVLQLRAERAR